jgi:hypothetical protein
MADIAAADIIMVVDFLQFSIFVLIMQNCISMCGCYIIIQNLNERVSQRR